MNRRAFIESAAFAASGPLFRHWPVPRIDLKFDVVILGATPSGCMAALAATRGGASVAVIEPTQRCGGMFANGLCVPNIGDPKQVGGLQAQFYLDIAKAYRKTVPMYYFEPHIAEQVLTSYLDDTSLFLGKTILYVQRATRWLPYRVSDAGRWHPHFRIAIHRRKLRGRPDGAGQMLVCRGPRVPPTVW